MSRVHYSAILARGIKLQSTLILFLLLAFSVSHAQLVCDQSIPASQSIHVSKSGINDVGCGSPNAPCATINYGIGRAQDEGLHHVRISKGVYFEIVIVKNGIHLWGGYDESDGWTYGGRVIDKTTIHGGQYLPDNQRLSVKVDSIESRTVLSDLTIEGPDAVGNGRSSYALHITNSDSVYIQNCEVVNGMGSDGANGANGSDATQTAAPGGGDGADAQSFSSSCNTDHLPGGTGGTNAPAFAGGDGGDGGSMDTECNGGTCVLVGDCSATSGFKGVDGDGNPPGVGLGGEGGIPCHSGLLGDPGRTTDGNGGTQSATNGYISGDYWLTTSAGNGSLGAHGGGGGGGGGSGGCDVGIDDQGAGGGGGGSGGIRAPAAGLGGHHGGNSYGIFAIRSILNLKLISFSGGTGGNGGNGGVGGWGQPGGPGGIGGSGTADTGPGRGGGKGGNGGDSGGGAGGNGGSVIYVLSSSSNITTDEVDIMGSGISGMQGFGGTKPQTPPGQDGKNGQNLLYSGSNIDVGAVPVFEPPCGDLPCLVVNNKESGAGSFRDAIACLMPGDTLFFDQSMMNDTILLDSAITINKDITIYVAPGQNIWIKGIGLSNTLKIMVGSTVEIIGLKVWGSNGSNGVLWNQGDLILRNVLIFGDNSPGAIFLNEGILKLESESSIFLTPI